MYLMSLSKGPDTMIFEIPQTFWGRELDKSACDETYVMKIL